MHIRQPPTGNQKAEKFITRVLAAIEHHRMFTSEDHVVVGVSGGADSVALLHALYEVRGRLDLRLTVAHLNHGLRGDTARREAENVQRLARTLDLPCVCETRDARADAHQNGLCLQEAARAVRYRFLNEVRTRCKAHKIALGHTLDDQAETVLLRLLRGASTRGLGGIPPMRSGTIVRPLIHIKRIEIEHFLQERNIGFIPDSSAHELHYLRNRVRHELLPLLARNYNPRIVEALTATADLARSDEGLLNAMTMQAMDGRVYSRTGSVHVPVSLLEHRPELAGRIVRNAVATLQGSCRGLTSRHTDAVLALTECRGSAARVCMPGGLVARREYDQLVLCAEDTPVASFAEVVERLPADLFLQQVNLRVQIRLHTLTPDESLRSPIPDTLYVAPGSIQPPFVVRSWKPGDRLRPLGFSGKKKVKAIFAEKKIPVRLRNRIPVIESGGRIACVGALRMAEHCRVEPHTRNVLAVTVTSADVTDEC